ncbi:2-amino-4-hydroxy-6-hydroxymethyldihydropteridine diphosphokinase [Dictyobacter kobayashii]|uniref:2-amino-4-hydroxy-6-hydroxymethyldihydropteridine diphosphokinase n=1 Tax=Dictyobacter kobayashii TaxID=2014872 RepID=A0A402APF5_9CHLR|nr:2-amino-4-hydroxy-6-hydroxymethyldihydropteridine diphosphokinase [Dictyobacter kobayashii]GCE20997.1 2-amino-4-hydroxy-6-hydroxymethyldihydropteridine diphosphokinase [Dictyobacter kobayashii]
MFEARSLSSMGPDNYAAREGEVLSERPEHCVYLALGSNLGDRQAQLKAALGELRQVIDIQKVSSVYETEPVGYLDQPPFFNIVCWGYTHMTAPELLKRAKDIERQLGRQPTVRNGPRLVDIDILLYDTLVYAKDNLIVPHPRMGERAFVLIPLAEIAPDVQEPRSGHTARELLQNISQRGVTRTSVLL